MTDSLYSAQLEIQGVALGSPPQSGGEDAHAESKKTEIQTPLEMDSARARGFAPHPGNAGSGGAIHQSSADAADVDRSKQRDVLERAKASTPLPLDLYAADS
jgi:hypothetical protein